MKKSLFYFVFILLTSLGYSQKDFQEGYYVEGNGAKVQGYLQVMNFEEINTTQKLFFKKTLNNETIKIDTDKIMEFGVGDDLKYQRFTFEMEDVSFYKDFGYEKDLQLKSVNYFLNVLVEGDASLYSYENGNGYKYFYSVKSKQIPVQQLVYKKYIFNQTIKENNTFKEQLFKDVKNEDQTFNEFVNLKYEKQSLVPIVEKFNKTTSHDYKVFKNKLEKSTKINLSAMGGAFKVNSKLGFAFGGEFELVTPSEKLAFFSRLKFEKIKMDFTETYYSAMGFNRNDNIYKADYKSMDLLVGVHYFFKLNTESKIFIGVAGGINSTKVSGTLIERITNGGGASESEHPLISSDVNFFPNFSIGYVYKNKYAVDLEIDVQKVYFNDRAREFTPKYNKIGINLRYIFY